MELLNATKMQAGYTLGMQPDGRESLVVVVKGTFRIPADGGQSVLAEEQVPLVMADTFSGQPGLSAPVYESEYVRRKPKCDVLLNGTCYAPGGTPTTEAIVSVQIGAWSKSFNVIGNRVWKKRLFWITSTGPERFTTMPISYNTAFGGEDKTHKDPAKHKTFMANPSGTGFHHARQSGAISGKPLPNTEEINRPIKNPWKDYRPMALGPLGRNWEPRPSLAGTYDQDWLDNGFPFLPADFNEAYYQAAPNDQQIEYPMGGEQVILVNLTPNGRTEFHLPTIEMPIVFFPRDSKKQDTQAVIDTVILEPDLNRFMMVWRSSFPLKRNIFDVVQVVAGVMPKAWYRARELGKTYYRSLGELVAAKIRARAEVER